MDIYIETEMRTNLQVPFADKDEAKQLGARWDAARKLWYVENKADMSPFARWMASTKSTGVTGAAGATGAIASKQSSSPENQSNGITIVGSRYVEHPRVCDCLPWEVCDLCRAFALNH
jgi:hypothetical protein